MAYHSHKGSNKYNISEDMKLRVSFKRYTRKDFIDGMKRYELIGNTWSGISEKFSKKAYINALICGMAAEISKDNLIDFRDKYISRCSLLSDSKEMISINGLIEKYENDDIYPFHF